MKLLDYTLKFSFFLAVSLSATFIAGPLIYKTAMESKNETLETRELGSLEADFLNENTTKYIKLEGNFFNGERFQRVFNTTEKTHLGLFKFFKDKKLITDTSPEDFLPIVISNEKLVELGQVQAKFDNKRLLEKLIIDNTYIIGAPESSIRIVVLVILSIIIILLGVASFVVGSIMFYKNYNTFKKTGKLPEMPNTAENKIKGIKFLLGKKEKSEK
ncbi:hypothetical protein [Aquimarina mytili]|uniref:Uncharacterized protein n=1 Tax=Aquimarina mytili TaxID=874423 RepID=A0A937A2L6_9FLAO|nr:hypothetical protein [Aquimarina mytili]MBL0683254.1 hypothetical protein [Aquimarina mytili]